MCPEDIFVGEIVRFRQWADMAEEYGLLSSDTICVPFGFTKEMRTLCGTTATVVSTIGSGDRVSVRLSPDPAWSISAAMLEPDVENDIQESDQDLKSLFV